MKTKELRMERLLIPVLLLSALSIGLLFARTVATGTTDFWFLNWNLFLAWLPLVFAWYFLRVAQDYKLSSWQSIAVFAIWLLFLPNSFYLITDFVHLEPYQDVSLMLDIILFFSYALTGLLLGMMSVYLMHIRLRRRLGKQYVRIGIAITFWLSGLAIYYGRYLGWNSWDVFANPSGILLDTIDRVIRPFEYFETFTFAFLIFTFLSVVYASFYYIVRLSRD